ncbi:hypothetical protein [Rhodopseudomonas sp. B29]|uniref:hypothetical protein n=1 Tax=Rhodopseudomonas sp. B29 TaxID=95607 RepID=UPI00131F1189|nr:hypothetical protein [Rhodopseudomonas sp. B29]
MGESDDPKEPENHVAGETAKLDYPPPKPPPPPPPKKPAPDPSKPGNAGDTAKLD